MKSIEAIQHEATVNKWPYPKTFEAYKTAGIRLYRVLLGESYQVIYEGTSEVFEQTGLEGYQYIKAAKIFSQDGVKEAIRIHMNEKTSYVQLLADIAHAGVTHYVVDMSARAVFYYNEDETEFHREDVPHWKDS